MLCTTVKAKDFIKDTHGNRVVIPIHSGKDLKQGTLMGMIQDISIDKEAFSKLLRK